MLDLLEDLGLSHFRWFRRLRGGHWELWYVDVPVCSDIWHRVRECSRTRVLRPWDKQAENLDYMMEHWTEYTGRPTPLCRGTPHCEDY